MNKDQTIQSLRTGLEQAIKIIEQLDEELNTYDQVDPKVGHTLEHLKYLYEVSVYQYDTLENEG